MWKWSTRVSKSKPKSIERDPKASQMEPKGSQREATVSRREPKERQKLAKGRPKYIQKSTFGQNREKSWSRGAQVQVSPDHFGSHFRWKIDEKIDAKINTEKVMKIDEISMWKWSQIWILSEGAVREKTYFPEKADVRYTLAGCSRMRVGEGSSEKKEIEKMIKIVLKTSKNRSRKRDVKNIKKSSKKHPKKEVKMKKKPIKNQCWEKVVRTIERPGTELMPLGPGGPTNQQDNIQTN